MASNSNFDPRNINDYYKLLKDKFNITNRNIPTQLPSTQVINEPNWRPFQTSSSTAIVPQGDVVTNFQGQAVPQGVDPQLRQAGESVSEWEARTGQQPTGTERIENQRATQAREAQIRAERQNFKNLKSNTGIPKATEAEKIFVDKAGSAAPSGLNAQRANQIAGNFKPVNEAKYWIGQGKDKIVAAFEGIKDGVASTPQAQRIQQFYNTPLGKRILDPIINTAKVAGKAGKIGLKAVPILGTIATIATLGVEGKQLFDSLKRLGVAERDLADLGISPDMTMDDIMSVVNSPEVRAQYGELRDLQNQLDVSNQEVANEEQALAQAKENVQNAQAYRDQLQSAYNSSVNPQGEVTPTETVPTDSATTTQPTTPITVAGGQPSMMSSGDLLDAMNTLYGFVMGGQQPTQQAAQPTIFDAYNATNPAMNAGIQAQRDAVSAMPQATPFDINPETGVARIYDNTMNSLNRVDDLIRNDYRYRGDVVQPETPYSIDPNKQNYYQKVDDFARMLGINSNLAGGYAQQQLNAYQGAIANQLGVPYQDYAAAMQAQQENLIKNEYERNKIYFEQAKNDAQTYQERLKAEQALADNERATRQKLAELAAQHWIPEQLQMQRELATGQQSGDYSVMVQNLKNIGDMQQLAAKLNDPTNKLVKASTALMNYGQSYGIDATYSMLKALSPAERMYWFSATQPVSDEMLDSIFPNQARRTQTVQNRQNVRGGLNNVMQGLGINSESLGL